MGGRGKKEELNRWELKNGANVGGGGGEIEAGKKRMYKEQITQSWMISKSIPDIDCKY